jgi:hypothetical protein
MDCLAITKRAYAKWLGVPDDIMYQDGIHAVKSNQRDIKPKGFPIKFDIYIFIQNERIVISYNSATTTYADKLLKKVKIGDKPEDIAYLIQNTCGLTTHQSKEFVLHHPAYSNVPVKELTLEDYPLFLKFFKTKYPKVTDIDWLYEYYQKGVNRRCVYGILVDNALAAATEAPDMPYMEDEVQ